MPRDARLQALGFPLHVIAQGIERRVIFCDDSDRIGFVLRAVRVFEEEGLEVLAWALMGNHVHFVLRPTLASVSKAMQRLLGPYAQGFNRRHGRVGRLFRDRFWSRPVEDEDDLVGLIGYVILNPLRGGLAGSIEELCDYQWTSLGELITPPKRRPTLVDRVSTLSLFGPNPRSACEGLVELIAGQYAADPEGCERRHDELGGRRTLSAREKTDLRTASSLAMLRRSATIDGVLRKSASATALRLRLEQRGWTLDRVVARAAALCGASEDLLRSGSRRAAESGARGLVAFFAGVYLRCPDTDSAVATGVSRQAVNGARARGIGFARELGLAIEVFFELDGPVARAPEGS